MLALIPAIGWGIQPLIARRIGGKPANQIVGTGLGALLVAIIIKFFSGNVGGWQFVLSFIAGFLWSLGQVGQFISFNHLGVAKTMPISTGLQIVGTALIGVLIFGEWAGTIAKIIGLVAIGLIIIGVSLTAVSDKKSTGQASIGHGLLILIPTSVGYWAYGALPKLIDASGLKLFFPEMIGVFVGSLVYAIIRTRGRALIDQTSWENGLIGVIFAGSSLAYIFAAQSAGVATAFVITQLNVVVSTVGSLVILHEVKSSRELKATIVGLVLIVAGSMLTVIL